MLGSRGEAAEFAATQKVTEMTANKTGNSLIPCCKNITGGAGYKHFLSLFWIPHFKFAENILACMLTQSNF